jgi:hypothetical protein
MWVTPSTKEAAQNYHEREGHAWLADDVEVESTRLRFSNAYAEMALVWCMKGWQ